MSKRRRILKEMGNFRMIKITAQHTTYAIQYKFDGDYLNHQHVRSELASYLNARSRYYGDWTEYYISTRKECNKQFTFCVLKWA